MPGEARAFHPRRVVADAFEYGQLAQPFWMGERVGVRMTLTAPGCPAAQSLPVEVVTKLKQLPGITDAHVDIVWDPPWDKDRMSDAAKLQLGMF